MELKQTCKLTNNRHVINCTLITKYTQLKVVAKTTSDNIY